MPTKTSWEPTSIVIEKSSNPRHNGQVHVQSQDFMHHFEKLSKYIGGLPGVDFVSISSTHLVVKLESSDEKPFSKFKKDIISFMSKL